MVRNGKAVREQLGFGIGNYGKLCFVWFHCGMAVGELLVQVCLVGLRKGRERRGTAGRGVKNWVGLTKVANITLSQLARLRCIFLKIASVVSTASSYGIMTV